MSEELIQDDPLVKVGDKWVATVDPGDGSPQQRFSGDTREEVLRQLIKAQTHATKTIREQKRRLKLETPDAAKPIPDFKPRQLTPEERFRLSQQINDPVQGAEAVQQLVESVLGAPVDTIRESLALSQQQAAQSRMLAEAKQFLQEHPEFKACPQNDSTMLEYLQSRNMAYTARNLSIAFDDLKEHLILNTAEPQVATVVRPRSASTGIPSNTSAPRATGRTVGPTAEEINRMSPDEYRRKLADPQFRAHIDKLFSPKSPRS